MGNDNLFSAKKSYASSTLIFGNKIIVKAAWPENFIATGLGQEWFHKPADSSFYDNGKTSILLRKKAACSVEEEMAVPFGLPKALSIKLCHLKIITGFWSSTQTVILLTQKISNELSSAFLYWAFLELAVSFTAKLTSKQTDTPLLNLNL